MSAITEAELALVLATEGWLSAVEARLLYGLAAGVGPGQSIVEIGNYRGRSTVALALGSRAGAGGQVYSFDPHTPFVGPRGGKFGHADQAALYTNLSAAGVGDTVSVVTLDARLVGPVWPARDVGLLFIDGDHRYEAVRADFTAWAPHLVAGATVLFDDVDFVDVARCVAEIVAEGRLIRRDPVGKVGRFEAP